MVRLDKNKIQKGINNRSNEAVENTVENSTKLQSSNSELEKFSQYVLKMLADENIPSTPNNFQIYFEKLLDNKPLPFKKSMNDLLESENSDKDEHRAKMETDIKEVFSQIKNIMKVVLTVYKNINIMKEILKKRTGELEASSGQLTATNIASSLGEDLKKLSMLMKKQIGILKIHYEKTSVIFKNIENTAIFDSRFGIYNRRYFLKSIENECKSIEEFDHKSTLVLVKIKDTILSKVDNTKERMVLTRNIAKLLLKTSRRSDIVAHYGDGVFGVLMKHTDIDNAKRACTRISDLIHTTSFFIGEIEIEIDIELAMISIIPGYAAELFATTTLNSLGSTGKELLPYAVCELKEN
ncbi:MAG: diguanylate cyclase [Sulfurospirillum sp.]|nr:diguanylate cyclase [Sulfurospirillum sp.]MBL0703876.1 diguanylate cyclase [Sulfurospirillum sp.]